MKVHPNSFVTITFLIRLGEEEFYPHSGQPEQISFPMGQDFMPSGLEAALVGMEQNENRVVKLNPKEAFGEIDQELIQEIPRSDFDPGVELTPGMVFQTEDDHGHPIFFLIQEVHPEMVVVDFNHPLAGRDLEITVTLDQVREAAHADLHGPQCACGGGEPHSH